MNGPFSCRRVPSTSNTECGRYCRSLVGRSPPDEVPLISRARLSWSSTLTKITFKATSNRRMRVLIIDTIERCRLTRCAWCVEKCESANSVPAFYGAPLSATGCLAPAPVHLCVAQPPKTTQGCGLLAADSLRQYPCGSDQAEACLIRTT